MVNDYHYARYLKTQPNYKLINAIEKHLRRPGPEQLS